MKRIKLNNSISMDLEKLISSKLLIQANSGGGKSWLIRRLVEQAYGKVQIIIIDPEGEFSTLREKYDFVLAGKDGDTPAESKSAGLLARKLLELKVSAIIDIYELHPQERKHFVKLFLESMVNAPKNLYHDVLVVLDEAHMFAPEKDPSEATAAVIDLASRGRKRGYCAVLATQRISKLAKDAAAECNNKLIGRTSLDIDRKRAADELGITSKEEVLALRSLEPGEFFAFGPAISNEVIKIKVGDVKTSVPKAGSLMKVVPPTDKIKRILGKLADLPEEAKKEATTVKELKQELAISRRHRCPKITSQVDIDMAVKEATRMKDIEFMAQRDEWIKHMSTMFKVIKTIGETALAVKKPDLKARKEKIEKYKQLLTPTPVVKAPYNSKRILEKHIIESDEFVGEGDTTNPITGSEQKVLNALAWCESISLVASNELVAFLSGYKHCRSTGYTNPRGYLKNKGLIVYNRGSVSLTDEGRTIAVAPNAPLTQDELHRTVLEKIDGSERKVLQPLLEAYPEGISNTDLCAAAGYMHERSTGYTNPRGRLKSYGLIEHTSDGLIRARDILFI